MFDNIKRAWRNNVDNRVVFSSALGGAVLGGVIWLANRSGVKAAKQAANVAKGGK